MFINKILAVLAAVSMLAALPAAEHDHDHDHDHAHEGHAGEGAAREVGDVTLASVTYGISVHGSITAGGEAVISISVEEGTAPSELRAWVGVTNGRGSVKALLRADEHGGFHGHLEVPATLPEGSALWIEVATDAGRERGSVGLPAAGAEGEAEGHDHEHESDGHDHDHDHKDANHGHEDHDDHDDHKGHDHD